MIEFGAPLWLLGLLAIPWLRRLHRSGIPLREQPIASLEAWPSASTEAADGASRPPPDPAWRRRAAILALLLASLAQPGLRSGPPPLTVWIDDTASLATIADGASRLERAQARLADLLAQGPDGRGAVEYRRFTQPPPPRALDPRREHWLLSDGSRPATAEWLREAPIARVIAISDAAGNVGLVRLAARASLREGGGRRALVGVANGSGAAERRRLEFSVDGVVQELRDIALKPRADAIAEFAVPAGTASVAARLLPSDALASDDRIELALAALAPLGVSVTDDCPPELRAALAAHPALDLEPHGTAALLVACNDSPASAAAQLRFTVDQAAPGDAATLRWSRPAVESIADPASLPTPELRGALQRRPGERVLASVDGAVVLTESAGPPRVLRSSLTPQRGALSTAEHAQWVAWLVERTVGVELLGRVAAAERPDDAARVEPAAVLPAHGAVADVAVGPATAALVRPVLALAALLLAWELALQLRRAWRNARARSARA